MDECSSWVSEFECEGIFYGIGHNPNTDLFDGVIDLDDNGYITKYMHNKRNLVKSGNKVNLNKPIAEMGNTGSLVKNEGIHVHFELWKNGKAVNPIKFIKNLKSVDTDNFSIK